MKHVSLALLVAVFAFAASLLSPPRTIAASPSSSDVVLRQEARWLVAIVNGDGKTVASILSTNFKHVTSQGKILDRAQELASMNKEKFTMNPTEQTVDFAGDVAVVHGLNTITQSGKVLARERFTDVFVKENGSWKALSAQETAI
jgi:ketosteroid isomerase-like protein